MGYCRHRHCVDKGVGEDELHMDAGTTGLAVDGFSGL